jgi:hypothetical protein
MADRIGAGSCRVFSRLIRKNTRFFRLKPAPAFAAPLNSRSHNDLARFKSAPVTRPSRAGTRKARNGDSVLHGPKPCRKNKLSHLGSTRPGSVKNHNLDDAGTSFDWRPASALDKQSVKGDRPAAPSRQKSCSNQMCLGSANDGFKRYASPSDRQSVPFTVNDRIMING